MIAWTISSDVVMRVCRNRSESKTCPWGVAPGPRNVCRGSVVRRRRGGGLSRKGRRAGGRCTPVLFFFFFSMGGGGGGDRGRAVAVARVVVGVVDAAAGYRGQAACTELLNSVISVISTNEIVALSGPGVINPGTTPVLPAPLGADGGGAPSSSPAARVLARGVGGDPPHIAGGCPPRIPVGAPGSAACGSAVAGAAVLFPGPSGGGAARVAPPPASPVAAPPVLRPGAGGAAPSPPLGVVGGELFPPLGRTAVGRPADAPSSVPVPGVFGARGGGALPLSGQDDGGAHPRLLQDQEQDGGRVGVAGAGGAVGARAGGGGGVVVGAGGGLGVLPRRRGLLLPLLLPPPLQGGRGRWSSGVVGVVGGVLGVGGRLSLGGLPVLPQHRRLSPLFRVPFPPLSQPPRRNAPTCRRRRGRRAPPPTSRGCVRARGRSSPSRLFTSRG